LFAQTNPRKELTTAKLLFSDTPSVKGTPDLIRHIDQAATEQMMKPSEYIRRAIVAHCYSGLWSIGKWQQSSLLPS
jgi:hypothetical protein